MEEISTYYTLKGLADELGVHPLTIQLYISAGLVETEYIGDLLRIKLTPFELKALKLYALTESIQRKIRRVEKNIAAVKEVSSNVRLEENRAG